MNDKPLTDQLRLTSPQTLTIFMSRLESPNILATQIPHFRQAIAPITERERKISANETAGIRSKLVKKQHRRPLLPAKREPAQL